jgi:hypothetical protein
MKLYRKLLCSAGAILLLTTTSLLASEKSAISIMKNAYDYTGAMDKYAFDAIIVDEVADKGVVVNKYKHAVNVKVDRPGNLRVDVDGEFRDRTNYVHNGKYTMVDHAYGYYAEIKASKTIDGTLDYILKSFGINAPLSALIFSDMGNRMHFKSGKYFGTMNVAGVECDYVAFKDKKREVHAWIATGDKPLVHAYSIIDTKTKGHPRINTSLTWHTDAKILKNDFVFTPSKDVMKISVESAN